MIKIHKIETDRLYIEAVNRLIEKIDKVVSENNRVALFLSGGSSVKLYKDLANFIENKLSKPDMLVLGQVDERRKEISNFKFQISNLNNNINSERIGEMGVWEACKKSGISYHIISQEGSLEEAANEYNRVVRKAFEDCSYYAAVLGIGEDGHTAGLLPGYAHLWNIQRHVTGFINNGIFKERITLTTRALGELDYAIAAVSGENKRIIMERLQVNVTTQVLNDFPAAVLLNIDEVDVFTDIK